MSNSHKKSWTVSNAHSKVRLVGQKLDNSFYVNVNLKLCNTKWAVYFLTKQFYGSSTLWNLLDNGNCHSGSDAGGNGVFLPRSTNHVYASKKGFSFLHTSNKNRIPQRIKSVKIENVNSKTLHIHELAMYLDYRS